MEHGKKTNILLVGEDPASLTALESALLELDENLAVGASGQDALRALAAQDFAVILLDARGPGSFGFETASLIRQHQGSERTPILFATAWRDGDPREVRGYSLGAVDYIHAPVAPEVLRAKVGVFVELEKRRQASRAELARSNAELEQFAYVVSHDLQEPVRMVGSYVQLLADRYRDRLDANANDFISYAVEGAARMRDMIAHLLAYSRVRRQGRETAPMACEAALEKACASLQAAMAESSARVTHDPLPTVTANASQIVYLFRNLIDNAVKFRGLEPPRIHVSAQLGETGWLFSVCDNGIGLERQHADRIFVMFQRLHSREEYPGAGAGLAISKQIVECYGGRIWVESEPGKGATFWFTIPAEVPDRSKPRHEDLSEGGK